MHDDLEQYRVLWSRQPKHENIEVSEIRCMIRQRAKKATHRIRRNFWYELIVSVFILLLTSYFLFSIREHQISIILFFCVVLPLFILYVLFTHRFLTIKISDQDLKTSLQYNIQKMERTHKLYYRSVVFGFPFLYFLALTLALIGKDAQSVITMNVIFLFLFGIFTSLLLPKPIQWFIQKVYGAHLEELKTYLDQLENI